KIADIPTGVGGDLAELCLDASAAIRLERNVAFSHAVSLRGPSFVVRFDPITGSPPRLTVPFEVTIRGRSTAGVIWLWTGDPLTLALEGHTAPRDEAALWAIVLLGYADLTVWPEENESPSKSTATRAATPTRPPSEPHKRSIPRRKQRRRPDAPS